MTQIAPQTVKRVLPISPDAATKSFTLPEAMKVIDRLQENITQAVVVKPETLRLILITILGRGHLLLEDVPGVGKTLVAKALARSIPPASRTKAKSP